MRLTPVVAGAMLAGLAGVLLMAAGQKAALAGDGREAEACSAACHAASRTRRRGHGLPGHRLHHDQTPHRYETGQPQPARWGGERPRPASKRLYQQALRLGARTHGGDLLSAAAEVRHWLEAFGEQCLVVFDDAGDFDMLQQFVPAAGDAQVVITSSLQEAADLGLPVPVGVFTQAEALAFLGQRTHNVDASAARDLAAELGYLPLALAQAAAVIRRQRLSYASYLKRLQALPVSEYLTRAKPDPYPHGTAAAVLLSMDSAGARDRSTFLRVARRWHQVESMDREIIGPLPGKVR